MSSLSSYLSQETKNTGRIPNCVLNWRIVEAEGALSREKNSPMLVFTCELHGNDPVTIDKEGTQVNVDGARQRKWVTLTADFALKQLAIIHKVNNLDDFNVANIVDSGDPKAELDTIAGMYKGTKFRALTSRTVEPRIDPTTGEGVLGHDGEPLMQTQLKLGNIV